MPRWPEPPEGWNRGQHNIFEETAKVNPGWDRPGGAVDSAVYRPMVLRALALAGAECQREAA